MPLTGAKLKDQSHFQALLSNCGQALPETYVLFAVPLDLMKLRNTLKEGRCLAKSERIYILEKYKTLEWIIVQKTVPFICVFDVCLLCRNRHPLTSLPFWSFQVKRRKIRFCDGQYLAIIHLITLFRFLRRRSTHFSRQR